MVETILFKCTYHYLIVFSLSFKYVDVELDSTVSRLELKIIQCFAFKLLNFSICQSLHSHMVLNT